jgi:hypothetical protein
MSAEWVMNRISPPSAVLRMLDDVSNHPVAGLAMNRTEAYFGRKSDNVVHGLVDQENARLDEENLVAQPSKIMGVPYGSIRIRAVTQTGSAELGMRGRDDMIAAALQLVRTGVRTDESLAHTGPRST